jgi:PAS domain S-box-containing protein
MGRGNISIQEYELLFNKAPVAMYILDEDYHVIFQNEAASELSGMTSPETLGRGPGEVIHCINSMENPGGCGLSRHCGSCLIRKTIRDSFRLGMGIHGVESILEISRDGKREQLWLRLSSGFLEGPEGNRIVLALEDISIRKNSESALLEREQRYSALFRENKSIILLIEPESGDIIDANPSAQRFYGWSQDEFRKKNIHDINILTREELHEEMQKVLHGERDHYIFRHRRAYGDIKDIEVYSGPVDLDGRLILLSVIHDISDRVRAERRLEDSERTARALIDANTETAFLIDRDGNFITMNDVTAQRLNGKKEDFIGKNCFDFLPPDLVRSRRIILERVLETKEPVRHEDKRKGRILDNNAYPILDADGEGSHVALYSMDISERKKAEEERERIISELQTALNEIKTLSGLIPICSRCKKVRDDSGYWDSVETYIERHSKTQFSHSLCPDCARELYGNHDWFQDSDKPQGD